MKTCINLFCVLVVAVGLFTCATRGPDYRYESDAIRIYFRGDPRLNLYQGSPHTLVVCTYQLNHPNAFNQLADDRDGLSKLLDCSNFDGSVAYTKRIVVQPGQDVKENLDRAEGARYVGLVAGYFKLHKEGIVRLYRIPVGAITGKPGSLDIELYLGPQTIQKVK